MNVLSPVRMAEKGTPKESVTTYGNLHDSMSYLTEEKERRSKVRSEDSLGCESKKERLPFPTSYGSLDATGLTLPEQNSANLHGSRSQDLPVYSSFSPEKTQHGTRLSPRRSPRQSPLQQSSESNAILDGSSERSNWRNLDILGSSRQDHKQDHHGRHSEAHDDRNSITHGLSAVEDVAKTANTTKFGRIAARPVVTTTASDTPTVTNNNTNNEELLAQLEVLRMQNTMLTHRIQRAQQDSHLELERERTQRQLAVTQLTQQNQQLSAQLNQSQVEAQRMLQHEKEQFLSAMKLMQQEREVLDERVRKTEQLAQEEQQLVRMQKAQLQDTLKQLESEKDALMHKLKENEERIRLLQISQIGISSTNSSTDSSSSSDGFSTSNNITSIKHISSQKNPIRDSPARRALPLSVVFTFPYTNLNGNSSQSLATLQQENAILTNSLQQLTQQTALLHTAIDDNNTTAAYNTTQLALQLSNEKALLELRVNTMSKEQTTMQMRLHEAEETVRTQNALAETQFAQEKHKAEQELLTLQERKEELIIKINNSKGSSKQNSFHHTPRVETMPVEGANGDALHMLGSGATATVSGKHLLVFMFEYIYNVYRSFIIAASIYLL